VKDSFVPLYMLVSFPIKVIVIGNFYYKSDKKKREIDSDSLAVCCQKTRLLYLKKTSWPMPADFLYIDENYKTTSVVSISVSCLTND